MPVRWLAVAVFVAVAATTMSSVISAQSKKAKKNKNKNGVYTRPKPTRPMHPEIPSANRYRQDKVFLEQADSLYRRAYDSEGTPGRERQRKIPSGRDVDVLRFGILLSEKTPSTRSDT